MRPRRHRPRGRRIEARLDVQALAVALTLAAPFLSRRALTRWQARIATWQRAALQDAARLGRLAGGLARYTADARDRARAGRPA